MPPRARTRTNAPTHTQHYCNLHAHPALLYLQQLGAGGPDLRVAVAQHAQQARQQRWQVRRQVHVRQAVKEAALNGVDGRQRGNVALGGRCAAKLTSSPTPPPPEPPQQELALEGVGHAQVLA